MTTLRQRLSYLLYGKPQHLVYRDDRLGELTSIVRKDRPGKWCLWEGSLVLAGQPKETAINLWGDSAQPFASLLAETHAVLEGVSSIKALAAREIERRTRTGSIEDYYLSELGVWEVHDDILQIELSPVGQPILDSELSFDWSSGAQNPHRVVLRRTDTGRIARGQQIACGLA